MINNFKEHIPSDEMRRQAGIFRELNIRGNPPPQHTTALIVADSGDSTKLQPRVDESPVVNSPTLAYGVLYTGRYGARYTRLTPWGEGILITTHRGKAPSRASKHELHMEGS